MEERGSKFLKSWDERYTPLLETHDQNQEPQKGGWVYAPYGKGVYIYSAYAWYRQLPHAVAGAFRLYANMISLRKTLPNKEAAPATESSHATNPHQTFWVGVKTQSKKRARLTLTSALLAWNSLLLAECSARHGSAVFPRPKKNGGRASR